MYSQEVKDALAQTKADLNKMMSVALGSSSDKHPEDEAIKDRWLMSEGFKPIITPQKEILWIPNAPKPTEQIAGVQKGQNSMSNETLMQAYPFLKYAVDNYIPVVESLCSSVQAGDMSMQYLGEMVAKLMKEGVTEAVEKTGGSSKQGAMMLSKAASAAEAASIISSSSTAVKQLGGE